MVYRRKIYLLMVVVLVIFAGIMVAFIVQKDSPEDYKGTLVKQYNQEVIC